MGYHKCESLASEFMLWTYSVWVHLGSCGLLWAHLGSGPSERIYLPGQGRLESKIHPNIYFFEACRALVRMGPGGQIWAKVLQTLKLLPGSR